MRVRSWVTVILGIACLSTAAVAQPRYDLRRLDVEAHFGLGARAAGGKINDVGQFAGYVKQGTGPALPFIWNWETDTVTVIDEGMSGFFSAGTLLINNEGQLADILTDAAGITAVRLWDPIDGVQQLSVPISLLQTRPFDLNDQGEAAGILRPNVLESEAVVWSVDGQRNLGWLSPQYLTSSARGILDSGETVGDSIDADESVTAVYWSAAGEISELIGTGARAKAINASGEIVGQGGFENGTVGLYWSDRFAVPTVLPCTPEGSPAYGCFATQINDRGEILGLDDLGGGDWPVIWVDGQIYLVQDLIEGFPDTEALFGYALNNRGEIGGALVSLFDLSETPVVLIPQDTTRDVRIDVEPFQDPGCLEIDGLGSVPVAIFGEADFDVVQIDQPTLRFEGLRILQCATEFVDADAFPDLVCEFVDEPALWTGAEPEGTLVGQMLDGTPIEGTDGICLVEPGGDPHDDEDESDDNDETSDDDEADG